MKGFISKKYSFSSRGISVLYHKDVLRDITKNDLVKKTRIKKVNLLLKRPYDVGDIDKVMVVTAPKINKLISCTTTY